MQFIALANKFISERAKKENFNFRRNVVKDVFMFFNQQIKSFDENVFIDAIKILSIIGNHFKRKAINLTFLIYFQ